tara:strand:+ start:3471 stop:3752 length:282 start_codon:yes stop_codon:yes gene_type:complete
MTQATTDTFDINEYKDRWDDPASYNQIRGLASKFAKTAKGQVNWQYQSQIKACLYSQAKAGKLTFKQANDMFAKKSLPKVYKDAIAAYLAEQQ